MIPITFLVYPFYSIKSFHKVAEQYDKYTIQYKEIKHIDTKQERDTNVCGSPNPWVTSTKLSHYVIFIQNNKLQPQQFLLPKFL